MSAARLNLSQNDVIFFNSFLTQKGATRATFEEYKKMAEAKGYASALIAFVSQRKQDEQLEIADYFLDREKRAKLSKEERMSLSHFYANAARNTLIEVDKKYSMLPQGDWDKLIANFGQNDPRLIETSFCNDYNNIYKWPFQVMDKLLGNGLKMYPECVYNPNDLLFLTVNSFKKVLSVNSSVRNDLIKANGNEQMEPLPEPPVRPAAQAQDEEKNGQEALKIERLEAKVKALEDSNHHILAQMKKLTEELKAARMANAAAGLNSAMSSFQPKLFGSKAG
jgi:hypothetical protein